MLHRLSNQCGWGLRLSVRPPFPPSPDCGLPAAWNAQSHSDGQACAHRETIEQVQQALEELERRVSDADRVSSETVGALRSDMVESVRLLREQRERSEATAAEMRGAVHDVETAATGKLDALQTRMQARRCSAALCTLACALVGYCH